MNDKKRRRKTEHFILFSIGFKLVIIITIIVGMSLGSIIALVSWLVQEDLRIAAEVTNFETNRRSAMEAENTIVKMRSDSLMLIQTLISVGVQSALAQETAEFFFDQNPQIAAMFFTVPGQDDELLVNRRFFLSRDIDASLADSYRENNTTSLKRAALGETVLLNAAPHFTAPLLALFFPRRNGRVGVLFAPENLHDTFGFGTNQSYMINESGDILIHADFELVRTGMNMSEKSFIRDIQKSPDRSKQILVEADFGIARSGPNTEKISFVQEKWENLNSNIWTNIRPYIQVLLQYIQTLFNTGLDMESDVPDRRVQPKNIEGTQIGGYETVRQFVAYTKLNTGGCTVITSIEYDMVFEGIAATTRRNIWLALMIWFISIMVIWFFAKRISVPLKVLAATARDIEGGAFEHKLRPKGRDEIGILTASFQKMCTALSIFGRFTNRDIAIRAMRGHIKPGGVLKHATIFFSDIRDFTEKSENFTKIFGDDASDRIVLWLNDYFTRMIECIEKTNGIVDKFIGDAVMAHWGTAYTAGNLQKDAFNGVFAALMMRKALYEMNKGRKQGNPGNPPIHIGCGINTGIVTAGQLGSDMRMEYTVIGDPVNLASRIEALNKPLGTDILISEDTWHLVKNYFITEEMPPVTVKGKEKPVRIFAVVNLAKIDKGPQTLAEVRQLLEIENVDISRVDINKEEKKYEIEEGKWKPV